MNPVKIAAIILVISAGLISSYFIIKNSVPALPSNKTNDVSTLKPLIQNPLKWVENTVKSIGEAGRDLVNSGNSLIGNGNSVKTESGRTVNLTQLVAQSMFNKMKDLDEQGKNPFEGQGFDPNDPQSQKLIQETVASIQEPSTLFKPKIENKDLKISSDNSKEAKLSYLKSIQEIGQKYFGNPDFQRDSGQLIEDIDRDCLAGGTINSNNSKIASAYNDMAINYLNLDVPSDWSNIHRELITYLKGGQLIFEALAGCSMDPLKGYLAMKALPQFASESRLIQEALKEKSAEIDLLP